MPEPVQDKRKKFYKSHVILTRNILKLLLFLDHHIILFKVFPLAIATSSILFILNYYFFEVSWIFGGYCLNFGDENKLFLSRLSDLEGWILLTFFSKKY